MTKPRQVVLLMTNSRRWDMLDCYRKTGLQKPNLDRLAAGAAPGTRPAPSRQVAGNWAGCGP